MHNFHRAGEPSPPSLDIVASGDLSSLSFTIFPPTYAVSCVLHYAVTTIRYRNSQTNMMDFTIPANTTNPVTLERDGFDMCRERYNFTVRSLTRGGEGMRSDIIRLGIVDFIGTCIRSPSLPSQFPPSVLCEK